MNPETGKRVSQEGSYRARLEQELSQIVDSLELGELQKHFLRSRWLDQVMWMGGRADSARARYYLWRLIAIIGGVIVPALVSLDVTGTATNWTSGLNMLTFFISLAVAISVAVEEFFHYGERWRHYRRMVEVLKSEGWQFFQLSGTYRKYHNHAKAFPIFAERHEAIMQQDIEVFISGVVKEQDKPDNNEKPDDLPQ